MERELAAGEKPPIGSRVRHRNTGTKIPPWALGRTRYFHVGPSRAAMCAACRKTSTWVVAPNVGLCTYHAVSLWAATAVQVPA